MHRYSYALFIDNINATRILLACRSLLSSCCSWMLINRSTSIRSNSKRHLRPSCCCCCWRCRFCRCSCLSSTTMLPNDDWPCACQLVDQRPSRLPPTHLHAVARWLAHRSVSVSAAVVDADAEDTTTMMAGDSNDADDRQLLKWIRATQFGLYGVSCYCCTHFDS